MFNKIILIGNLTRDIELRYTPGGQAVAKCGIATNRKWKDSGGNQQEEVMFIDFTVWGRTAEIANQYLHKGSRVLLEGRLTLEQWTDQNCQKRSRHTVTVENLKMLDRRGEGHGESEGYGAAPGQPQQTCQTKAAPGQPNAATAKPEIDIDEDDIPF